MIYISGPMTGYPDLNYPAFKAAQAYLESLGFVVSNPAQYSVVEGETWEECLKRDLRDLLECQGVATLPGWSLSRGARLEVRTAKAVKIPVHSLAWWAATGKVLNRV